MDCSEGHCKSCKGMILGLIGVLILINAFVWPQWSGVDGWMAFFGFLLIFVGIGKSLMPGCGCHNDGACCQSETPKAVVKEAKKKR